jgi:polysaccharide deacetylase family protein (PEP-CTERM system associated)
VPGTGHGCTALESAAVEARPALLLSIDFEDWHQLVHRRLGLADWDRPHEALVRETSVLLDLLDELGARATFFLLGMTVSNHRELVAEIVRRGHEPACHGYAHARVYEQSRDAFRADLERAVELLEDVTGRRPLAYRAPAFSINRRTPWAYEVLAEAGFRYDSSQYDSPRVPDRLGGIPDVPYRLAVGQGELWELPIATWGPVPVGGGSYWRLLPPRLIERGLRAFSVLYFHPYEFDPLPLRPDLPRRPTARQRLTSARLQVWRNAGRTLIAKRVRTIARGHRLVSYDQAYDDIHRLYGARTRALSPEGVLV